jgi:circadian clock protein KaiC
VSTVADTWIHISYAVLGGERNRALTIIKSRGTEHSNQVRELVLNSDGITLADVYRSEGEVLMGTARWQKEMEEKSLEELKRVRVEQKRNEFELAESEYTARMQLLQQELALKRAELDQILSTESLRLRAAEERQRDLQTMRSADSV